MKQTFEQFMRAVDTEINVLTGLMGLTHDDIVDYLYYDAWEDGGTAQDVARDALENDELFGALFD